MAFTGADFDALLDIKTDTAYTGYFSSAKKNLIIQEAITKAVEFKVATNDRIQVQDDLFGIFKSNTVFTPINNEVDIRVSALNTTGIDDYHHIMNMSAKFIILFQSVDIVAASATTPLRLTISRDVNLRSGESVLIAGVNAQANGTRYVKRLRNDLFELYSDQYLTTPIVGTSTTVGATPTISRIIYNDAYNMKSNRKFSELNAPSVYKPFYEVADTVLKIYPNRVCSEIKIDYISVPAYIDVTDSTDDLLEVYSFRFIQFIADETARLMALSMRDDALNAQEQGEILNQP